ncbi:MAG: DUF1926 domain-containing protein [Planctomycetia bacterium]|nr:DUF1926 domain-containing protein [Planctomycetia bacterium]
MDARLRFVLVLHNHQPVGNLDCVAERIYEDSYRPFLDVLADYPTLPLNLHASGSLLDWLSAKHPEYVDRLGELVAAGRVELLGGAYHDPILPMLPPRDRRGQIRAYGQRLAERFGRAPRGLWLAERIWEPALTGDLAAAGIEHTVLDDVHFLRAGLAETQLAGYYLTEHEGQLVAAFAGREPLRYLIPFAEPAQTIDYLRRAAGETPGGIVIYADDGEKFGAWPGMREHVYHERWLRRFFDALAAATDWLHVTTLTECIDHVPPLGKVYIPEGSYREMSVWSSLGDRQTTGDAPAGTWRNFRVKYPEINEMYCRMLMVSRRLESTAGERASCPPSQSQPTSLSSEASAAGDLVIQARDELYQAQCGCAYWHGLFGGVHLAHLRQAVYRHLIAADRLLDAAAGRDGPWVAAVADDFDLDVHKELALASDKLMLLVAPERGGMLYELDVREAGCNLLATLAQHAEPRYDESPKDDSAAIGRARTRPQPLGPPTPRKSLVDHFFDVSTTLADVAAGRAIERGDFASGRCGARLRRIRGGVRAELTRRGAAWGRTMTVSKQISLPAGRATVDVTYALAGLLPGQPLHFGIEFNFAGPPLDGGDRRLLDAQGRSLGDSGVTVDLADAAGVRLADRALGLLARLDVSQPAGFWAFPVFSVSRSQEGWERIGQSVVVMPHWVVTADARGCFSVDIKLSVEALSPAGRSASEFRTGSPRQSGAGRQGQRLVVDGPHAVLVPNLIGQQGRLRSQDA